VLTHGFVVDEKGLKMSEAIGNTVSPEDISKQYGAEIMRLWVASSDWSNDLKIGKEIIQTNVDAYRKLRNTLRYMIGALDGFLTTWLAPVLSFTMEEVWQARYADEDGSVHLQQFLEAPDEWLNPKLESHIETIREFRTNVSEVIEPLRKDKVIRSSLEARIIAPADSKLTSALSALGVTRADEYRNVICLPKLTALRLSHYLRIRPLRNANAAGSISSLIRQWVRAISHRATRRP